MEYYSALKRKEILSHVITLMNLDDIMLSEISQFYWLIKNNKKKKDKYCMIPLICGT